MIYFRNIALLILIIACLAGCSIDSFIDSKIAAPPKSTTYQISHINNNWTTLNGSIADVAYVNKKNNSTISLNSTCERYQDNPLKQLMYNLLANMEDPKWENNQYITLDGREAYKVTIKAKADGVPIKAQAIVMRKNYCVYDFLYSAESKYFNNSTKDFDKFVGSFHAW
jgi:hypothetical protein